MYGIIYKTTNLVNGKIYIGQHRCDTDKFDGYLGSGSEILKAIDEFGKENFKRETLKICNNQIQLNGWECYFILKFNATDESCGYNLLKSCRFKHGAPSKHPIVRAKISASRMGKLNPIYKHVFTEEERQRARERRLGVKMSEESRRKLSEARKGMKFTEQHRLNIRKATLGDKNPNFGKRGAETAFYGHHHSEEFKKRHSKRMSGEGNPSFGKFWITNGVDDVLIKRGSDIPDGWRKGRSKNNRIYVKKSR